MKRRQIKPYRQLGATGPDGQFPWRKYFVALMEHKLIALLTFVVVVTGVGIWTFTQPPIYRATAVLQLDNEDAKLPVPNASSSENYEESFFATQQRILESRTVCERAVNSLSADEREQFLPGADADADLAGALQHSLSVVPVRGSRLVEINIDHPNPKIAALLANAVTREFINRHLEKRRAASMDVVRWLQEQGERAESSSRNKSVNEQADAKTMLGAVANPSLIPAVANNPEVAVLRQRLKERQIQMSVLQERYKEQHPATVALQAEIDDLQVKLAAASNEGVEGIKAAVQLAAQMERSNMQLIDPVRPPASPYKPNKMRSMIIGIVLGLLGGIGIGLLAHSVDNRIKSFEDVESLGLPLLSGVPHLEPNGQPNHRQVIHADPNSIGAEAFRSLRASLNLHPRARAATTLLVTSAAPGEGKSLVAANLAIAFAVNGERTLLIDADMHRPTQHQIFDMNSGKGLSAFLTGAASIDEVVHPSDIENLDLLTVGALPRNPAELLGSTHMPKLLQKVAGRYGRIVIDSPPVTGASDPLVLLPHIKGVIFVVGFSKTRREIVARTMHRLRECCAPLLGVVLNNINLGSHSRYYYPYRYSYYYRRPTEESDSRSPIVRERRLSEKTLT